MMMIDDDDDDDDDDGKGDDNDDNGPTVACRAICEVGVPMLPQRTLNVTHS